MIEKRRKELLERLFLLQGGTLKKDLPVTEPRNDETASEKERSRPNSMLVPVNDKDLAAKEKSPESISSPSFSSPRTSPRSSKRISRRDSLNVSSRIKDYEIIHHNAKKDEENETPKWLVSLKKVSKPTDFPAVEAKESSPKLPAEVEESSKKENIAESVSADKVERANLEVNNVKMDTLSIASGVESFEEEEGNGKEIEKKKKSKLGFSHKMKGLIMREKSPVPERIDPLHTDNHAMIDGCQVGAEAEKELEEGVRMSGDLERMKKRGKKHKSVKVKVYATTMILGDKEELELANCSVETTDLGFDLTHPQHKTSFMFKVDGTDKDRQKWVTALRDAIREATAPIAEEGEIYIYIYKESLSE